MMTSIQGTETPRMTGGQVDPVRTSQDTSSACSLLLALSGNEISLPPLSVLKPMSAVLKAALHKIRVHVGQEESRERGVFNVLVLQDGVQKVKMVC